MLKLLLCITTAMTIGVGLLRLRQERLDLSYQANRLHRQLDASQSKLWNQQLQIAVYTAPNAIAKTVGDHDLKMATVPTPGVGRSSWVDEAD